MKKNYFYKENFNEFALDELPYDKGHTALGEYHYVKQLGYIGDFYDPISNHQWRSMDGSWLITSDGSKRFLEQNRGDNSQGAFKNVYACLVFKDPIFCQYHFEYNIRIFEIGGYCGMAFSYETSRDYYAVGIKKNKIALYKREQEDFTVLAEKEFLCDDRKTYHIEVCVGNITKVFLDEELCFQKKIKYRFGKCGLVAKSACRYSDIEVWADLDEMNAHKKELELRNDFLLKKRSQYSEMECIKKIDLKNFGSARQLRIGRFENNEVFFILGQHQKRMMRDSFARLSSLTAFDINGNVLWQKGEPNNSFNSTAISCDLPIQIADINGDGKLEVIYSMDFEIIIVDARTGVEIKKMDTPIVYQDELVSKHPFYRLNVDAIRVADFSGKGYKSDFIIKDRYQNVWAYDENFDLLWRYHHKNTGHFPYIFDYDKDGCDEMYVGYDMIDHDGTLLWSLPMNTDHTDEIIYCSLKPNEEEKFILASGNEGFNIINKDGTMFKHNEIGHAQRISVAHYDSTTQNLTIAVTAFWGSEGIVCMYDAEGRLLKQMEQRSNGNVITPVAYDGVHELCLLNASEDGGLVDSELDKVVLFPNDGHPTLCCEVYDIDDDGVDEIICWDQKQMWIYKAKVFSKGNKYDKYPDSGFSNYRGEYLIKK